MTVMNTHVLHTHMNYMIDSTHSVKGYVVLHTVWITGSLWYMYVYSVDIIEGEGLCSRWKSRQG